MVGNVSQSTIAKGKFGVIGNKGAIAISFSLYGRLFNFIGCHLIHSPKNYIKRN